MKKILTHLTLIVFVITILISVGCSTKTESDTNLKADSKDMIRDTTEVSIYLNAINQNKGKNLKMHDSNKPTEKVVDDLRTLVWPGMKVTWRRTWFSGIKEIEIIKSKNGDGNIFRNGVQQVGNSKRWMLEIPLDAGYEVQEEYYIIFKDKDGNSIKIDPHLKIPPKL